MSGTIQTIRPNAEGIDNAGGYAGHGSGSLAAVTSDSDDATWMVGVNAGTVVLGFATFGLAANERCLRVRPVVRLAGPLLAPVAASFTVGNFASGHWASEETFPVAALGWVTGAWRNFSPGPPSSGDTTPPLEWVQSAIDGVQIKFHSTLNGGSTAVVYEEKIELEILVQPTVTVTGPSGTNPGNTHKPTVTWTHAIGDGYAQKQWLLRVFDLDVNSSPTIASTTGRVYDSGIVNGTATSKAIPVQLPNGNYRVLMEVAKDFNGTSWWSATSAAHDFTINDALAVPTLVGPTGAIKTGFPTFQAKLAASTFAWRFPVYGQWEVASDSGFTTNVQTFTEATRVADTGGTHYLITTPTPPATAPPLTPATWFLRARTLDTGKGSSAWSTPVTFDVSYQGVVDPVTPLDGDFIEVNTATAFTTAFTGWLPTDYVTASQFIVQAADGTVIVDTGKVPGALPTTTLTLAVAGDYQWQSRSWDNNDVPTEFTALVRFTVADLSSVTFGTIPSPITVPGITIGWSVDLPVGRSVQSWRLLITDVADQSVAFDYSGNPSDTAVILPVDVLVNAHSYTFTISINDSADTPASASVVVAVAFVAPDPLAGLAGVAGQMTPVSSLGEGVFDIPLVEFASLTWTPTAFGPFFQAYEVQRVDGITWTTIALVQTETLAGFDDYEALRAVAGAVNQYRVRVIHSYLGPSAWTAFDELQVHTTNDTDVILASNTNPELTVAYNDEGPYEFTVLDVVTKVRVQGRPAPLMFREPGAIGDTFSRTLILAMPDSGITGEDAGRVVFEPLLARIRDTRAPYVALLDGYGHRWYTGIEFAKGRQQPNVKAYLADVTFTEVSMTPVLVEVVRTLIEQPPPPPAIGSDPIITTTALPDGSVNGAYSQQMALVAGASFSPAVWSISAGSLPAGLSINPSTSEISGVPTAAASSSFTVKATGADGREAVRALTINVAAGAPGQPSALAATTSSGHVALTWTAPTDSGGSAITGYDVYRRAPGEWVPTVLAPASGTSYTDATVTDGSRYTYWVTAKNVVGASVLSTEIVATPPSVVAPATTIPAGTSDHSTLALETLNPHAESPPYPINWDLPGQFVDFLFTIATATNYDLLLRYAAADGDATRRVTIDGVLYQAEMVFPQSGTDWDTWATVAIANRALTVGNHHLRLLFDSGSARFMNPDNLKIAVTGALQRPNAPTNLSAAPGSSVGDMIASWTAPFDGGSAITGYTVLATSTDGGAADLETSTTPSVTLHLDAGKHYYFTVTATNAIGNTGSGHSPTFLVPGATSSGGTQAIRDSLGESANDHLVWLQSDQTRWKNNFAPIGTPVVFHYTNTFNFSGLSDPANWGTPGAPTTLVRAAGNGSDLNQIANGAMDTDWDDMGRWIKQTEDAQGRPQYDRPLLEFDGWWFNYSCGAQTGFQTPLYYNRAIRRAFQRINVFAPNTRHCLCGGLGLGGGQAHWGDQTIGRFDHDLWDKVLDGVSGEPGVKQYVKVFLIDLYSNGPISVAWIADQLPRWRDYCIARGFEIGFGELGIGDIFESQAPHNCEPVAYWTVIQDFIKSCPSGPLDQHIPGRVRMTCLFEESRFNGVFPDGRTFSWDDHTWPGESGNDGPRVASAAKTGWQ